MKTKLRVIITVAILLCTLGAKNIAFTLDPTYYSQGNLPANLTASWNTQIDGLGSAPANFTSNAWYVIQSGHNMITTASWIVSMTTAHSITINNGGSLTLSNDVTINSNITFIVNGILNCGTSNLGGSGATTVSASAIINIGHADGLAGNISTNGSNSFSPGATYVYNGSVAQAISSFLPDNLTGTLKIDNSNGVSLNRSLTITSGTLDLTSGILKTRFDVSTIQNLTIGSTATLSNYNSNSFVNGPLLATLSSGVARTFPIGSGTTYRPITLNMSVGQDVSAEMFNSAPSGSLTGSGVNKISSARYYSISNADPSNCTITLPWGSDDGVSDLTNITVVYGGNGSGWISNSRSGGTSGDASSGTVTGTFNSIIGADFTLGNKTGGSNPLPVEMTSFTAIAQKMSAQLQWTTANEVDNYGFEIERRAMANSTWIMIGFVAGAGSSNIVHNYIYIDNYLLAGTYAYRIKQINNNGVFNYSNITELSIASMPKELKLFGSYPNPFNPTTKVQFTVPANGNVRLNVFNIIGQKVATLFNGAAEAGNLYTTNFDASRMATGLYFSVLEFGNQRITQKMLMTK
jgi:hypothetical protein